MLFVYTGIGLTFIGNKTGWVSSDEKVILHLYEVQDHDKASTSCKKFKILTTTFHSEGGRE